MRILRVELTHFRGIDHADVCLDPDGVTIVEGPNEVGKSCLAEAIGLIRRYHDSSRAKDVLDVQPVGSDVGPEVEIEVTTGDHHFVYRKRFVRKPRTELEVRAPQAAQISGREAHDRVEAIFAETLDAQLWDALQMMQGESLQQPVLARIAPLRTALGEVEGAPDAGGHQDLLERVEQEYAAYFTPTGRPTGQYASLATKVAELSDQVAALDDRIAEVDDRLARHEGNATRLTELTESAERSAQELQRLQRAEHRIEGLRDRVDSAAREVAQADERRESAVRAVDERRELVAELSRRTEEHEDAEAEAERTRGRLDDLQQLAAQTRSRADDAQDRHRSLESALRDAAERLGWQRDRRELSELLIRLERAEAARRERDEVSAELASVRLDTSALDELLDSQSTLFSAEAARDAGATRVRVERLDDADVLVDGSAVGEPVDEPVRRETTIEVPGHARVKVRPGTDPGELHDRYVTARDRWESALARFGVADLDEARTAVARGQELRARLAVADRDLEHALGEDSWDELSTRCRILTDRIAPTGEVGDGEVRDGQPEEPDEPGRGISAAEREVEDAGREVEAAREAADEARAAAQGHDQRVVEMRSELIRLQQKADGAGNEIRRVTERLAATRANQDDAALDAAREDAENELLKLRTVAEEAETALADEQPDDLRVVLENEQEKSRRIGLDRRQLEDEQQRLLGQLADFEREGVQDRRDALQSELRDADRTYGRMRARAEAASLLRESMRHHLAESQQRYVAPFRRAVERLGRIVFGPDFGVDVTRELEISSRTLGGSTVPFSALSGGAKEQLALIGRLACAQLVSAADGAPVVLDDSLGFSDPLRLQRLAAVLNEVGRHAQIIILTCQPERFGGIGSARIVRLPEVDNAVSPRDAA